MPSLRLTYNDRAKIILVTNVGGSIRLSLGGGGGGSAGVTTFNGRDGDVTLLDSDVLPISRVKQQTLIDQAAITLDYSLGAAGVLNSLSQNSTLALTNLVTPSFVTIKIIHTTPGTILFLPGRKVQGFNFAYLQNDITLLSGFWNGVEWLWFSEIYLTHNVDDPIANAWIAQLAANGAVQDSAHQILIQNLIAGFRSDGLLPKFKCLWIPIFGSAAADKYNVLNPVDTDAAFRLTFNGTITHSSTGMQPDGATGWANTHFNPVINATINKIGIGVYSRVNGSSKLAFFGNFDTVNACALELGVNKIHAFLNSTGAADTNTSSIANRFIYAQRNNSATTVDIWQDGTELGPITQNASIAPNLECYIGGLNQNGTATFFSDIALSLLLLTDGSLSSADAVKLTNRINTFLTAWGINV